MRTEPNVTAAVLLSGCSPLLIHPRVTARPYPQRPMVDLPHEDPTPCQPPTPTELAEARAGVVLARQIDLDWLMASEEMPDVDILLAELVNRPAWHRSAACRGADPDLFFPERADGPPVAALSYCEACPVRPQCLAPALEVASTVGVWGGTTGRVRRRLRREGRGVGGGSGVSEIGRLRVA
jgi:hypothetical protein